MTADKAGPKQSVNVTVNSAVKSVQNLMVNTQLSSSGNTNSGWYVVNFGFNGNESMRAGPSDSKYGRDYARRDQIN